MLLLAAAVACAQSPEPTTAKRTVVKIPRASATKKHKPQPADADAEDIPSSRREATEGASEEHAEEEEAAEEAAPQGFYPVAPAGPTGGPECDAVADCCAKLIATMGSVSADPRMCEQYRNALSAQCSALLQQWQPYAIKAGLRCGP